MQEPGVTNTSGSVSGSSSPPLEESPARRSLEVHRLITEMMEAAGLRAQEPEGEELKEPRHTCLHRGARGQGRDRVGRLLRSGDVPVAVEAYREPTRAARLRPTAGAPADGYLGGEGTPYSTAKVDVVRVRSGEMQDSSAVEEPLEIRINGSRWRSRCAPRSRRGAGAGFASPRASTQRRTAAGRPRGNAVELTRPARSARLARSFLHVNVPVRLRKGRSRVAVEAPRVESKLTVLPSSSRCCPSAAGGAARVRATRAPCHGALRRARRFALLREDVGRHNAMTR